MRCWNYAAFGAKAQGIGYKPPDRDDEAVFERLTGLNSDL
jgi:hypothetical protein